LLDWGKATISADFLRKEEENDQEEGAGEGLLPAQKRLVI
jgi:hypothetical protein